MAGLTRYNKRALFGGIIAAILAITGSFLVGNLSGNEAKQLIDIFIPGLNTLCNTIVLASATILALLLTVLSLSTSSNSRLKDSHYRHILLIAKVDTIVFVVSLLSFQLFNTNITQSDQIPAHWFDVIYYTILIISSCLCGALISVVLMLYNTVTNIIQIVGLGEEAHPLLYEEEEKEKSKDKKEELEST